MMIVQYSKLFFFPFLASEFYLNESNELAYFRDVWIVTTVDVLIRLRREEQKVES